MKETALILRLTIFFLAGGLAWTGGSGCSATGGAEAGNPSRTIVGSVSPSGAAAFGVGAVTGCEADQVVAVDASGRSFNTNVAPDCSFEFTLRVPESYRLDFLLAGATAASMDFDNSPGRFSSPAMNLSPGDGTIYFDGVTIADGGATPSREPSKQNDQNGDGLPDFSDADDDGDGIPDTDERDCDLDGILDDFDADVSACGGESGGAFVLEVAPRNGEGVSGRGSKVKVGEEIRLRFSCAVDATTVTAANLQVAPENDSVNLLICAFSVTGSGKQVKCDHADFLGDTVYSAHLEGLHCEDGSEISAASWRWKTR